MATANGVKEDKWATFTKSVDKGHELIRTADPSKIASGALLAAANDALPFSQASSILDLGCGYATVTTMLCSQYHDVLPKDVKFLAGDNSPAMVAKTTSIRDEKVASPDVSAREKRVWQSLDVTEIDACDMKNVPSTSMSHVVAGLVLHMVPDPEKAVAEVGRVLQSGGVLSLTSWAGNEWLDLFNNECGSIAPDSLKVMDSFPKSWQRPEGVTAQLQAGGLVDVNSETFPCGMGYENPEAIIKFLGQVVPIFKDLVQQAGQVLVGKDGDVEKGKEEVLERIVKKLVAKRGDGAGVMDGTAVWAVGRKPA